MVAVRKLGFILAFFWASIMAFSILLVIDFSKDTLLAFPVRVLAYSLLIHSF